MFIRKLYFVAQFAVLYTLAAPTGRAADPAPRSASLNAVESQWHQWRGPFGTGEAADDAKPPLKWDDKTNIRRVADLPGEGSSTPSSV